MNESKCEKCGDLGIVTDPMSKQFYVGYCTQCSAGNRVFLEEKNELSERWKRLARLANPHAFQTPTVEHPSEPFTREEGWQYICTDEEKKLAEPKRFGDEFYDGESWEPVYSVPQDVQENEQFMDFWTYRRKLPSPQPVTVGEKEKGLIFGHVLYNNLSPFVRQYDCLINHSSEEISKEFQKSAIAVIAAWKEKVPNGDQAFLALPEDERRRISHLSYCTAAWIYGYNEGRKANAAFIPKP